MDSVVFLIINWSDHIIPQVDVAMFLVKKRFFCSVVYYHFEVKTSTF